MPIKFSKGFPRRRSSGNILDAAPDSPSSETSFRVLERPSADNSFGNGVHGESLKRRSAVRPRTTPMQYRRSQSYEDSSLESNQSSEIAFNMAAPQSRDSYASTTPSSIDSYSQGRPSQAQDSEKTTSPTKSSSPAFSFRSAARTFTFSSKGKPPPMPDQDIAAISAAHRPGPRERAMTESSYASTAVPPKLDLGSDLNFGSTEFGSSFGDMFAKRRSALLEEEARVASAATNALQRPPISSPESSNSQGSNEKLMEPPPLPNYFGGAEYEPSFGVDTDAELLMSAVNSGRFVNEPQNRQSRQILTRTRGADSPTRAAPTQHGAESSISSGRTTIPTTPKASLFSSQSIDQDTTPKARQGDLDDEPLFDPSKSARLAQFNVRSVNQQKQQSKVMTPAEFEHYRAQKDSGEIEDDEKSQSSEQSDSYEDDDEVERERQLAKQRRRQEAQLAVYRQQMMKVTGEQPSDLPSEMSRPKLGRQSMSSPSIVAGAYSNLVGAKDEDDDEDVPLGVLQAHGFPNKNRPPSRMTLSSLGSNNRPSTHLGTYPAPAGSTRNDAAAGGGVNSSLPVFARHLPQDPYVGASIVNDTSRESMQYGGGSPQRPASSAGLPPGGLVGVIAGEERARAMRRGSPNTQGTYDNQHLVQPPPMPPMPGMPQMSPMPGMPGMPVMPGIPQTMENMSPAEQAQMQVSNQMQQMMQMQMQWMQQMMQMQGMSPAQMAQMPGMQMPPQQPGFLSPNSQRPASSSNHQRSQSRQSSFMGNATFSRPAQSVYGPSSSQSMFGAPAPGYAPSIAPSERSNIGQPSRYRPVSSAGVDGSRASSLSQQTIQGLQEQGLRAPSRLGPGDANRVSTIRAIDRPKNSSYASDDEDEEGWAQFKKKKEERKSRWRRTKKTIDQETENGGLEGLYYEG